MLKKWQTSATIRETSYSNQETGRKLQSLYGIKIIGNTKLKVNETYSLTLI